MYHGKTWYITMWHELRIEVLVLDCSTMHHPYLTYRCYYCDRTLAWHFGSPRAFESWGGFYTPGMGNWFVKASTLVLSMEMASLRANAGDSTESMKSLSFVPLALALASSAICTPSWMQSATILKSFSLRPLVVIAGVPMRIPPGTRALLSPFSQQNKISR